MLVIAVNLYSNYFDCIMNTFTSGVSGKSFPLSEKVSASSIRACILDEVRKDQPLFAKEDMLSLSELNHYRNQYMQTVLQKELQLVSGLDKTVINSLSTEKTISDKLMEEEQQGSFTYGERVADKIAAFGGSWTFILTFLAVLIGWIIVNTLVLIHKPFDPYPFILLNLVLSCVAALQAPVIMMSQNRQESKDRARSKNDYLINLKSELEVRMLHEKIDHLIINQQETLLEIQQVQIDMMNEIMQKLEEKKGKL
jgi:uncharacterized membrane protein